MRAAASVFPDDRVQSFQAMHAEARRLKEAVLYAKEIEEAKLRRLASEPEGDWYEAADNIEFN